MSATLSGEMTGGSDPVPVKLFRGYDTVARGIWFVVGRRQQNQAMPTAPGGENGRGAQLSSAVDVLRVNGRGKAKNSGDDCNGDSAHRQPPDQSGDQR